MAISLSNIQNKNVLRGFNPVDHIGSPVKDKADPTKEIRFDVISLIYKAVDVIRNDIYRKQNMSPEAFTEHLIKKIHLFTRSKLEKLYIEYHLKGPEAFINLIVKL